MEFVNTVYRSVIEKFRSADWYFKQEKGNLHDVIPDYKNSQTSLEKKSQSAVYTA